MPHVFERLHESLQEVLVHRLGWDDLREVQEMTYLAVSGGKDVLVIAPTAGGKTEAALIPVTDGILSAGLSGVACIYLSPLKALINDQEDRFNAFSIPCGLEVAKWHGDVPKGDRSWARGEPPHFLLITPESLEVMLQEENLTGDLKSLRYVIIDEVHAFVESERGVHLKVLLDRLDRCAKKRVQRIGLSATVGNPEEILSWLSGGRGGKELVRVPVPPREKHFSFVVESDEKQRMQALTGVIAGKKAIVFVNSRKEAEEISRALKGRVEHLSVHHSSLSPQMRRAAEEAFSREGSACIISTSTLELGIRYRRPRHRGPGRKSRDGLVVPAADGQDREEGETSPCRLYLTGQVRAPLHGCGDRVCQQERGGTARSPGKTLQCAGAAGIPGNRPFTTDLETAYP